MKRYVKAGTGSLVDFKDAVETRIEELSSVTSAQDSARKREFSKRYKPTPEAISDWLYNDTDAYTEACNHFGCDADEDVADYATSNKLIKWIARRQDLAEKFSKKFGPEWF